MLTPTVRRACSPIGTTPLLRHQFRNDRISVICGLSVSPGRRRSGLHGMFFWDTIGQDEVCAFLHEVLPHPGGHGIALLDNSGPHRARPMLQLLQSFPRLHLEQFPPCAPEPNPDEGLWGLLKARLANGRPDDIEELAYDLQREFRHIAHSPRKLRGC